MAVPALERCSVGKHGRSRAGSAGTCRGLFRGRIHGAYGKVKEETAEGYPWWVCQPPDRN